MLQIKLAKSVNDIDWKEDIEMGKIDDDMYISQLDLCLEKLSGFTKKNLQNLQLCKGSKR